MTKNTSLPTKTINGIKQKKDGFKSLCRVKQGDHKWKPYFMCREGMGLEICGYCAMLRNYEAR